MSNVADAMMNRPLRKVLSIERDDFENCRAFSRAHSAPSSRTLSELHAWLGVIEKFNS